jgi:hypothetical protein
MPIEGCHCYACKPILGGVCCGIPDMLLLVTMYCVGLVVVVPYEMLKAYVRFIEELKRGFL